MLFSMLLFQQGLNRRRSTSTGVNIIIQFFSFCRIIAHIPGALLDIKEPCCYTLFRTQCCGTTGRGLAREKKTHRQLSHSHYPTHRMLFRTVGPPSQGRPAEMVRHPVAACRSGHEVRIHEDRGEQGEMRYRVQGHSAVRQGHGRLRLDLLRGDLFRQVGRGFSVDNEGIGQSPHHPDGRSFRNDGKKYLHENRERLGERRLTVLKSGGVRVKTHAFDTQSSPMRKFSQATRTRVKHFGCPKPEGQVSEMYRGRPSLALRIFAGCPSLVTFLGHARKVKRKINF